MAGNINMKKVLVLSPHLDDAVFSIGEHILQLKKNQSYDIHILTVFTDFTATLLPEYTNKYIIKSKLKLKLFKKARHSEDTKAMSMLSVSYSYLNLTDGGFRTANNQVVYKTSKELFSGKISDSDPITISKLIKLFQENIWCDYDYVLVPLAVGKHVDHEIVYQSAKEFFGNKCRYYLDIPYYANTRNWTFKHFSILLRYALKLSISLKLPTAKKTDIIKTYVSQYKIVFANDTHISLRNMNMPEIILGRI